MTLVNSSVLRRDLDRVQQIIDEVDPEAFITAEGCAPGAPGLLARLTHAVVMRINRRADYAIRVMLVLAEQLHKTRLSAQEIHERMQIPRAFLNRIIADLSRAGLIQTYPGPNGGLELARPAA